MKVYIKYRITKDGYWDFIEEETITADSLLDAIYITEKKCYNNYATFEPLEVKVINQ